jgi:hypothetical protein
MWRRGASSLDSPADEAAVSRRAGATHEAASLSTATRKSKPPTAMKKFGRPKRGAAVT